MKYYILAITLAIQLACASTYEQRLVHDATNPRLLYNAGLYAAQEQQVQQALNYFTLAHEHDHHILTADERFQLEYNLGNSYALHEQYQPALELFEALLKQAPQHTVIANKIEYLKKKLQEQHSSPEQSANDQQQEEKDQKGDSTEQDKGKGDEHDRQEKEEAHKKEDSHAGHEADQNRDQAHTKKEDSQREQSTAEQEGEKHDDPSKKEDGKNDNKNSNNNLHNDLEKEILAALEQVDHSYAQYVMKNKLQASTGTQHDKSW